MHLQSWPKGLGTSQNFHVFIIHLIRTPFDAVYCRAPSFNIEVGNVQTNLIQLLTLNGVGEGRGRSELSLSLYMFKCPNNFVQYCCLYI